MPLLPVSDLEKWSPLFRGTLGNAFARFNNCFFKDNRTDNSDGP